MMKIDEAKFSMISDATKRNWLKLHYNGDEKLKSRANKRLSEKSVLPVEYFSNKNNVTVIQQFVRFCKNHHFDVADVIFSVGMNLLSEKKHLCNIEKILPQKLRDKCRLVPEVFEYQLPKDENDILGLLYQMFMNEGEKNRKGSYYTPFGIAKNMTENLDFSGKQTFFDPCCGSGIFFLALQNAKPEQIFGCDNDPIAVMSARFNLLLKFNDMDFEPHIYCCDFLNDTLPVSLNKPMTYIVSNPPWGALVVDSGKMLVSKKESFSVFYEKSFQQLDNDGLVRFLLPESVLNVRSHKPFRNFLLDNGTLTSISLYSGSFNGVQTKYIDLELHRQKFNCPKVEVIENGKTRYVSKSSFYLTKNLNFNMLNDYHEAVVKKILSKGNFTLAGSIWALGVVTGDNKGKLKDKNGRGVEPIFTGKEVDFYKLKPPRKFVKYKRSEFQQVAKDEYYRAKEKLVYKFISRKLVFAYDNSGSLVLNSANVLIPNVPGMSIKTVMAFLNSELFQFVYKSMFGELKVLKGSLEELTFPAITEEQDAAMSSMVDEVLESRAGANERLQRYIYDLYALAASEVSYIRGLR